MHIAAGPDGNIYVAEYMNDRIQVFTPRGKPLRVIGESGSGPGQFDAPGGVAVDNNGNLYVADFYNQRIQKLSKDGKFLRQWGITGQKGSISREKFNYPTDVAIFPDEIWLAADAYNDRVKHYSNEGKLLSVWGGFWGLNTSGSFRGWFKVAIGVSISHDGLVYVADFYNNRIQVMNSDGNFYSLFGEIGKGPGQFDRPTDVAFGTIGKIFVVDYGNKRIQIWKKKISMENRSD